ncbi:MAG: hypothetical protein HYY06_24600 [Deltaproteobacteria bacterium]|nr:hypothetical protein [Deltaproteobacteria bacterium]
MLKAAPLLLAIVACASCSEPAEEDGEDCEAAWASAQTIEIGTGSPDDEIFRPLPDDGVLPLWPGPQGGYRCRRQ